MKKLGNANLKSAIFFSVLAGYQYLVNGGAAILHDAAQKQTGPNSLVTGAYQGMYDGTVWTTAASLALAAGFFVAAAFGNRGQMPVTRSATAPRDTFTPGA